MVFQAPGHPNAVTQVSLLVKLVHIKMNRKSPSNVQKKEKKIDFVLICFFLLFPNWRS
jgi:hypothetical protein